MEKTRNTGDKKALGLKGGKEEKGRIELESGISETREGRKRWVAG